VSKLARLLNIVTALQSTSHALTAEEIRERVPGYGDTSKETFRRTFERDKDDLRTIGVPIEVVQLTNFDPPVDGYRIRRDRYELPDPGLTPAELASLVVAARAVRLTGAAAGEADDALRKLGRSGDAGEVDPLGELEVPESLVELFGAILDCSVVEFRYQDAPRTVEPYRLQFERGHWYLNGWDREREAPRTFRAERILDVAAGPANGFERTLALPGVQLRPWQYGDGEPVVAVVRVDAITASSIRAEDPELPASDGPGGTVDLSLDVTSPTGLFQFLVQFLDRVELVGPEPLRDGFVDWLSARARVAS
jgi:predicted DNA-binding transcriptional regulator YafY